MAETVTACNMYINEATFFNFIKSVTGKQSHKFQATKATKLRCSENIQIKCTYCRKWRWTEKPRHTCFLMAGPMFNLRSLKIKLSAWTSKNNHHEQEIVFLFPTAATSGLPGFILFTFYKFSVKSLYSYYILHLPKHKINTCLNQQNSKDPPLSWWFFLHLLVFQMLQIHTWKETNCTWVYQL